MKEVHTQIEIDAPQGRVWDVITDLEEYAAWNPFLIRAEGKIGLGEKIRFTFPRPGNKEMTLHCTITEIKPGCEFISEWHIGAPFLMKGKHWFTLEKLDGGRVRFRQRETFHGLLVPIAQDNEATHTGFAAMDQALKQRSEMQ